MEVARDAVAKPADNWYSRTQMYNPKVEIMVCGLCGSNIMTAELKCQSCQATYGPIFTRGMIAMCIPLMLMFFTGFMATFLGFFDREENGPMILPFGLLCLVAAAVTFWLMACRTPHVWRRSTNQ